MTAMPSPQHDDRPDAARPRPVAFYVLLGTVLFQGISGVAGGLGMALDPSGASIGVPLEWLSSSPFNNYLIPGLVLFLLLGVGPLMVAAGLWGRRSWSWSASILTGLALFVWLGVEIAVIGYQDEPPLQLAYGVVAALIVLSALTPSVRRHLGASSEA